VQPLVNRYETDKWIDFWVICDEEKAYLFYTRNHLAMYYLSTPLNEFPANLSHPTKINGNIKVHEACMVYKIANKSEYWLLTETRFQGNKREYYLAKADRIDGKWSNSKLFATGRDLVFPEGVLPWSDVVSEGELIRKGINQRMEIPSAEKIEFVMQGSLNMNWIKYDNIPWQLGVTRNFVNASEGMITTNENSINIHSGIGTCDKNVPIYR
jgi:hypothetical protein